MTETKKLKTYALDKEQSTQLAARGVPLHFQNREYSEFSSAATNQVLAMLNKQNHIKLREGSRVFMFHHVSQESPAVYKLFLKTLYVNGVSLRSITSYKILDLLSKGEDLSFMDCSCLAVDDFYSSKEFILAINPELRMKYEGFLTEWINAGGSLVLYTMAPAASKQDKQELAEGFSPMFLSMLKNADVSSK